MKISYNWLKEYIDIDFSPSKLDEILTQIGLEVSKVEKIQSIKGGLEGLVIGEVISCKDHPNSDHLKLTQVNINGSEVLPIVCGAPNVASGQKVVLATIGTVLYKGDEHFTIKKTKIRGEVSMGMICAEDEIGLGNQHDGIMVLPNEAIVGTPAKEYFKIEDDYSIEIDLTPNRIDGASHIGVARDIAAFLKQKQQIDYRIPSVDHFKIDQHTLLIEAIVENHKACPRYSGICISGVQVAESPEYLQNRLKAIGLKPINNVVDITNYVLFETGQALHAFDYDKIKAQRILVKTLKKNKKFTSLDNVTRNLHETDLMICNGAEEPMCIAGVLGGIESGVTKTTTNLFLESAHFDPVYIRKTARRHGLNTDASFRFERGADPNVTVYALKRAALLIQEIAGGNMASEIVDIYPKPISDFEVEISIERIENLIGKKVGKAQIKSILQALEIKIEEKDDDKWKLFVPPYRVDVKREADIVEEILRIYGFNHVDIPQKMNASLNYAPKINEHKLKNSIANMLTADGFHEITNNSLTKASYYEDAEHFKDENTVKLYNPLSSDLNAMRRDLLFGGLECISHNINRKNSDLKLYEFGKSYQRIEKQENKNPRDHFVEKEHLGVLICGNKTPASWNTNEEKSNFFYLKSYVEKVLLSFGFDIEEFEIQENCNEQFSEGLNYNVQQGTLVNMGEIREKLLQKMEIEIPVYYANFNWNRLIKVASKNKIKYKKLPKYPSVKRDLALLIDQNIRFDELKKTAFHYCERKLLKSVSLFDVYKGPNLEKNKKSYAISFVFQDHEKTLRDKQVDKMMKKLIASYENQFNAKLR